MQNDSQRLVSASDMRLQAGEWCQAMCLSHARVGRSLRARMQNWQALSSHALDADLALSQTSFLHSLGWECSPPGAQVHVSILPCSQGLCCVVWTSWHGMLASDAAPSGCM